jgi:hypothetical protein
MRNQKSLTAEEMREHFDSVRTDTRDRMDKNGTGDVLESLSKTVSALRENDIDIKLVVRANSHSNAYDMMYTVSGGSSGTIEAHGFLKIGETTHLFAVACKHAGKDVTRLYLSKNNVVDEGGRMTTDNNATHSKTVIPGECYDFNDDPEALRKFQKQLLMICAQNQAVLDHDTGDVFNKETPGASLQKPKPKFKL